MKYQTINKKQKEKIAYEYLTGDKTYRELEVKYGICIRSIQRWVKKFEREYSKMLRSKGNRPGEPVRDIGADIKQMQEELQKARLHNLLLEELLDIGKEQYGIDLRKKTGAKQS
jgi:transposase-like protein